MERSRSPRRDSARHVVVLPIKEHPRACAIPLPRKRNYPHQGDEEAEAHLAALCDLDRYNEALAAWTASYEHWRLQDERLQLGGFHFLSRPRPPEFKWFAPRSLRGSDASGQEELRRRRSHDDFCSCRGVWALCCDNPLNSHLHHDEDPGWT